MADVSLVRLPLDECHQTLLMISQLVQVLAWCRRHRQSLAFQVEEFDLCHIDVNNEINWTDRIMNW